MSIEHRRSHPTEQKHRKDQKSGHLHNIYKKSLAIIDKHKRPRGMPRGMWFKITNPMIQEEARA